MITVIPPSGPAVSIRDRRDALGRDMALAHAALAKLIAAVHHADIPGLRAALESLQELGICLDALGLTECVDGISQRTSLGIDAVAEMLPTLMAVWETAQQGIVDRAFARGVRITEPGDKLP